MITYNHEDYIKKAVESVLMQKTNFEYELVIGEDCSRDRTRKILLELKEKYPKRISLLLQEKNIGMMENFFQTYEECKGEYIAILEGDDYWIDPYKLQKQVDFLEVNPNFVMCTHNSQIIYEDDPDRIEYRVPRFREFKKDVLNIEDQIVAKIYYHTSSVVFRNNNIRIPGFLINLDCSGDILLFTLLSVQGKIKYFDEVMSVYRRHNSGTLERLGLLTVLENHMKLYKELDKYLNHRYSYLYKQKIIRINRQLIINYINDGQILRALICLYKHLIFHNSSIITKLSFCKSILKMMRDQRYPIKKGSEKINNVK